MLALPLIAKPINVSCAACGFEAAIDFAFCPRCGNRLSNPGADIATPVATRISAPSASEAAQENNTDRRPVTVLFADLSGFTTLSERLDPEDVRALQSDLFRVMSATIQRFEGFVEKYVGDAVLAVFGAPVAHEDDPERAIRAALSMREKVAGLSAAWESRLHQSLTLHIGINTGPVVAGHIGSNRDAAYAVTGDTVNVAARIQSIAGPGQILVSRSTYRLAQHAFAFEALGEVALKGKAAAIPIFRVENALAAPRPTRGLQGHGLGSSLVGRERELAALQASFDRMLDGRTQVVRIVGEAGAGKSRLLAEFLQSLQAGGQLARIAVRHAACSSVGTGTYGVPAALLREAYGVSADDSSAVARRKIASALASMGTDERETNRVSAFLGYVLGLETDQTRTRDLEPEQLKQQIFFAAQTVIERRLEQSPLLLIIEDLHWTDAASIELLRYLVEQLPQRQFMLLVSHRPTAQLESFSPAHEAVRLEHLSPSDSELLLDTLFRSSMGQLPEELRLRIIEHAGGNPLFLEEMVRSLIADGVLTQDSGNWVHETATASVQVPLSIHGLLLSRIDRLPSRARQTIQEAAVIGPAFSEVLLQRVTSEPSTLDDALAVLVDEALLSPIAPARGDAHAQPEARRQYRFRHGLFQEVAYQNLLARRRAELHTRIGEALEALSAGAPQRVEDLQTLGHHFSLSSDKRRGAKYLVRAGDWAGSIYANTDAIRNYQLALETLANCDDCQSDQLVVREKLADVLAPVGQRIAAMAHFTAIRTGYAEAADRIAEARILRKMSALHWAAGQRTEATRCVQEGLALLGDGIEHIERAQLYQEMGHIEYRSGDFASALQWTQHALDQAERIGPVPGGGDERAKTVSMALNTQGVALARLNRVTDAVRQLERSVEAARAAGLLQAECRGLANLGVLYSAQNPQRAIEACERGLGTAQRIGDLGLQSRLYTNLAVAYCELTNRCEERGVDAAQTAIEIDRRAGHLDHLTVSLVVLGQIHQCHGQLEDALGYYAEAMALAEAAGEPQLLFPCYDGLATLYLDLDDPEQAEHYMNKATEICERAGIDPEALMVLPYLA